MFSGTEKNFDSAILLNFNDDDCSQRFGQVIEAFKALIKDDMLHAYKKEHDFGSSNDGKNIGYNLYVFDITYQKKFRKCPTK